MPQVYDTTSGVLAGLGGAGSGLAQGFSEAARLKIAGDAQKSTDEYRKAQTALAEQALQQQEELKQGLAQAQEFGLVSEIQQQMRSRQADEVSRGLPGLIKAGALQAYYTQKLQAIQEQAQKITSPEARALFLQDQREAFAETIHQVRRQEAMSEGMRLLTVDLAQMQQLPGVEQFGVKAQETMQLLASGDIDTSQARQEFAGIRESVSQLSHDFNSRQIGALWLDEEAQRVSAKDKLKLDQIKNDWLVGKYKTFDDMERAAMRTLRGRLSDAEAYELATNRAKAEIASYGDYAENRPEFKDVFDREYAFLTGQPEQQAQPAQQESALRQAYDPARHGDLDAELKAALKKNTTAEEFRAIFEKYGVNPSTYPVEKLKAAAPPVKQAAKEYADQQSARLPDEERLSPELLEKATPDYLKKPK